MMIIKKMMMMRGKELLLLHRVSVLVQRYNAVLLHDILPVPDCTD